MTIVQDDGTAPWPSTWRGEPAGFVSRLMGFAIDAILISIATSGLVFALTAIGDVLEPGVPRGDRPEDALGAVAFSVSVAMISFTYFTAATWLFGRTVGMLVMGLRIVRADGGRPHLWRSVLRTLGYLVSSVLMLGFVAIAVSRQRRAWHDHIGKSWVVYDWQARPKLAASDDVPPLPPQRLP